MKNIQIIDGAANCVYDIFCATDEEFSLIFPAGTDVAFIDEVWPRQCIGVGSCVRTNMAAPCPKSQRKRNSRGAVYKNDHKKTYYPTRRDEEAVNPDGTRLR